MAVTRLMLRGAPISSILITRPYARDFTDLHQYLCHRLGLEYITANMFLPVAKTFLSGAMNATSK